MGITQSVLCDFCNLERDSLQHCMWGCEHMKSFRNELERFICQNCENVHNVKFNDFFVGFFGTNTNFKSDNILNLIILSTFFPNL